MSISNHQLLLFIVVTKDLHSVYPHQGVYLFGVVPLVFQTTHIQEDQA